MTLKAAISTAAKLLQLESSTTNTILSIEIFGIRAKEAQINAGKNPQFLIHHFSWTLVVPEFVSDFKRQLTAICFSCLFLYAASHFIGEFVYLLSYSEHE